MQVLAQEPYGVIDTGALPAARLELFGRAAAKTLAVFLKSYEFIHQGEPVTVTGIQYRENGHFNETRSDYEVAQTFFGIEPTIPMASRMIGRLLQAFELTHEDQPVNVDGFRLRDPALWANYPATALESVGPISSFCNARCRFCYEQGNTLPFNARFLSVDEAEFRLAHYSTDMRRGLPIGHTFSLEALCNPAAGDILQRVHERAPDQLLKITTHGSNLTNETIGMLKQVKPIILVVSLNVVSAEGRWRLMADHHPEIALSALPKLREAGIPFVGSIVPWPTLSLDEVEETLRYFDAHDARLIRVSLPSYTRHFRDEDRFDTDEVWGGIIDRVLRVREELRAPVNMMPTSYWNQHFLPVVEGTYPSSPAAAAGLRIGDQIVKINEERVFLRSEVKRRLESMCKAGVATKIEIIRNNEPMSVVLEPLTSLAEDRYPYKPVGYSPPDDCYGIFLSDSLKLSYFQWITEELERQKPDRAVLFVSRLIKPIYESLSGLLPDFADVAERANMSVVTADCNYWGGNVMLGDLNVLQDIHEALEANGLSGDRRPDLMMMPGSFLNHRGFDLNGFHWHDLQRATGIRTKPIMCDVMMK